MQEEGSPYSQIGLTFALSSHRLSGVSKAGPTIVIAAAVIAAIRLAREDKLTGTPKSVATVSDALTLARQIYDRALKAFPEMFSN